MTAVVTRLRLATALRVATVLRPAPAAVIATSTSPSLPALLPPPPAPPAPILPVLPPSNFTDSAAIVTAAARRLHLAALALAAGNYTNSKNNDSVYLVNFFSDSSSSSC